MPMSYLLFRVEDFRNRSRYVQGPNICPESKMFIKRCIQLYFTAFSSGTNCQLPTARFSTRVSTMRCIHPPQEKLELVTCSRKLDLVRRVLIFNFVTIRIQGYLLKNVKFTRKNPKFPTVYQINSIKLCSSTSFQEHEMHIPIPPKFSAMI